MCLVSGGPIMNEHVEETGSVRTETCFHQAMIASYESKLAELVTSSMAQTFGAHLAGRNSVSFRPYGGGESLNGRRGGTQPMTPYLRLPPAIRDQNIFVF